MATREDHMHPTTHRNGVVPTIRRWLVATGGAVAAVVTLLGPSAASAAPRPSTPVGLPAPLMQAIRDDAATGIDLIHLVRSAPSRIVRAELNSVRENLATRVARALGAPPSAMRAAWARSSTDHLLALFSGLTQLGVPYRSLRSDPGAGFDCSGLTSYAWGQAGVNLAHQSGSQIRNAADRDLFSARAGDLVYYPGHVMLYLGVDNYVLHAPYSGQVVSLDTTSWHGGRLRFGDPTG